MQTSTGFQFLEITQFGAPLRLDENDTLELKYSMSTGNVELYSVGSLSSFTCEFQVLGTSQALNGFDTDLAANMPEMKQIDFLTSLQKMFNLVFIPSGIDKDFIIEPWDDYFDSGDEYDWSKKVLTDKTRKMRPTTDLQFKDYEWTKTEKG